LRERGDDVLLLAEFFLGRACGENGLRPKNLSAEARDALLAHGWPGNVRELEKLIERAVLLTDGETITEADLGIYRAHEMTAVAMAFEPPETMPRAALIQTTEGVPQLSGLSDREDIAAVLRSTSWNLSRAAALLGIPRNTLRSRLQKLGLLPQKKDEPGS